jgi:hypothetical protein
MNFRNATYNAFGTIDCEIEHSQYGWLPFTADPNDVEPIGIEVFNAAKETAVSYIEPPVDMQKLAAEVRAERDHKLSLEVDAIAGNVLRWAELTSDQQGSLAEYRLALLGITGQSGFPVDIHWPSKPD